MGGPPTCYINKMFSHNLFDSAMGRDRLTQVSLIVLACLYTGWLKTWKEQLDYEKSTVLKSAEVPLNLDFEISENQFIHLRTLVPPALLDQLWLRYTRWLVDRSDKQAQCSFQQTLFKSVEQVN